MPDRIGGPPEKRIAHAPASSGPCTIWTIGHSTRSTSEFVDLLRHYQISAPVDVRRFPGSSRFPHFDKPALRGSLARAGTRHEQLVELGGRRYA